MSSGDCIMELETDNKDSATEFDQEDKAMFQKIKEKNEPEKEKNRSNGQVQGSNPLTKIQRVPDVMKAEKKECWEKYFTPKAIAIGPIHHADSENLLVGEELKLMWAAKYLDGFDHEKVLKEIKNEIWMLKEIFAKDCLDKDEKDVHRTLARMLFVDGCAMLQFIYSFVWDDDFVQQLKINPAQATLIQQDLFLLENQIPFRVLQIIMEEGRQKMDEGVSKRWMTEKAVRVFIQLSNISGISSLKFDGAVHLLDLLRRSHLDDPYSAPSDDFSNWAFNCLQFFKKVSVLVILKPPFYVLRFLVCLAAIIAVIFSYIIYLFIHFLKNSVGSYRTYMTLDFVYLCQYGFGIRIHKGPITRCSFRNVQELKAAGIGLKPIMSRCLKDVSFRSGLFGGCLRLCPILVDKSTEGKLLNLIAYEMCPDSESYDYKICSYLNFLGTLIDNEQDVKALRAASILRHRLSSDKEVADLFNYISHISVADNAYGDVKSAIEEYYESRNPIWKRRSPIWKYRMQIWIAEFRQEYLSSPWKLLALIAAAAALGLTVAQTYFSINPRYTS